MAHTFENSVYGFETAKNILGIGSNTMSKLIDLNLISVFPDEAQPRNQRYAGWDLGFLVSARNRPLCLEPGEKALIASIGVEDTEQVPSPYFGATWGRDWCKKPLADVHANVSPQVWDQICAGELRVTGHWRVGQDDVDFLVNHQSVFLASYTGFLLKGGRIVDWVPGANSVSGGRCFLIKPFDKRERYKYAHNFLPSKPGPINKVWSAEELNEQVIDR